MNITPAARELIENCSALLLDFDGPMAALMPPPLNAQTAERVRQAAAVDLPDDLRTTTDHLAILRHLLDQPEALARAEAEATTAEIDCARTCQPAPWLPALLADIHSRGVPWAVVTNNSPQAVHTFLARFNYPPPATIAGRTLDTVCRLKPDPFLVRLAVGGLEVNPRSALFVGDSITDVSAGHAVSMPVLGYARSTQRCGELFTRGAEAVLLSEESTGWSSCSSIG